MRHVGFVCTRDENFVEVVESLGGVVQQLVDEQENVPMMEYKKLMLDGHPDIDCYIKGLVIGIGMRRWWKIIWRIILGMKSSPSIMLHISLMII